MKKTLLLIALVLCCAMTMFAQNNKISYQAVVRDTENKLVANKDVTVTVKIFDGDAQQPAYTQTYENVHTNLNGLISLQIGPAQPIEAWNGIHWNNARIETTVTLAGTELGMLAMPLTAVPYAFYADNAAHAVLADQAAQIDPNAPTITDIYEKMTSDSTAIYERMLADSLALADHLNDTLSEYVKKAGLCGEVKTCVADDFAAVYTKMHGDSLALAGQITNSANNLDTRIDSLRYANDTAQTNIRDEIADSAGSLNTKIGNLANSVDSAKTNIRGEIADSADSLNTKIGNLANSVDSAKTNIRGEIADSADSLNTKIGNLANSVDSAKTNIRDEIADSADSLNTKISNLANSVDSAKTNIRGEIVDSADSLNTKIGNLANSVDSAKTNIRGEIADSADSLNTKISNLSNSVDSAKTNIRGEIAALGHDVAANYYTKAEIDAQAQQLTNTLNALNARIDSVINVMNNLPTRMVEQRDTVQTAGQTSFTLAHEARADCVVRMYINGVMVGGNYNDVVTVSNTTVTYDPTKNGNYALKADDKVTIVYWY